jgi:hypothetical protein
VARRSTPRRGRASRKRRHGTDATAAPAPAATAERPPKPAPAAPRARGAASSRSGREGPGERPRAPWHPLPLSELLIFVGIVAILIGTVRGESGLTALLAGVGAVLVGTLDFTIREHRSGYRSHAALLAFLITALCHGLIAIALLAVHAPAPSWIVAPLVVDVPLFLFLFKRFRTSFLDARRERVFAGLG